MEARFGGLYPLDAPGMPLPGPDFLEMARRLGDTTEINKVKINHGDGSRTVAKLSAGETLIELYRRALREPGFTMPIQVRPGLRKSVTFVPGHIWGQHASSYSNNQDLAVTGPQCAEVMIIGKMPGAEDERDNRCLVGETGRILIDVLRQLHVTGTPRWYVTHLCKFRPPDGATTLKASWIKDCLPLLHQELRIVRPKYILCLGADASKELLGKKYNVGYMEGRVMEFRFSTNPEPIDLFHRAKLPEMEHTAMVMTVLNPASVARAPETRRTLERGIARFNMLQQGIRFDEAEADIDHRAITTLEELQDLIHEIETDPDKRPDRRVAVDAEWHGEHPVNKGSFVRTIQFSWKEKKAAAVILNDTNGQPCFVDREGRPAIKRAIALLNKYFANKRVGGHFFVADLEWLVHIGLDLRKQYFVPVYDKKFDDFPPAGQKCYATLGFRSGDTVPAFMRTKFEGGWDTGLRAHAIEETAEFGLEMQLMRYTTCPRYDIPLQEWKAQWCKVNNKKSKDLEGYGPCPDDILVPYGNYDADGTLRLHDVQESLIDSDYEGNCCREGFWESMITAPGILEMHRTGIPADKSRIDFLTESFMAAREAKEKQIRDWARWPEFNIRSVMQVRELLFGDSLNGKKTPDGQPVRLRPADAVSLHLEPLMDTSKPPMLWRDVKERGLTQEKMPGTSKTILGVLMQENPDAAEHVGWIRDYRFLDQVLKSVLRPPVTDDDGNWVYGEDDDAGMEGLVFDAGLAHVICDDGRIRTHLYPTAETARWRSARPNLQNMSKRRDPDYTRLLGGTKDAKGKWVGGNYKYKLRSIFKPLPGCVLVEADYIGAELYGMAIMSGDATMIEHAERNQLPEDHPNYYDIHSNVAKLAFGLSCEPTKVGLESIGKSHFRIVAKTVIFGIAYGRGAKAIAFEAKQEGIHITNDEAQRVIDTIFQMYPGLVPFFNECKKRAREDGWLCSCFGRFRRFARTDDPKLQGEFERQAQNFPIQSMIASAMDRAVAHVMHYRDHVLKQPDMFKMALQIHDALLLHVPYAHVEAVCEDVLPRCMCSMVEIWPTSLDGEPTGIGPFHLGIDKEVMVHWGEKLTYEQAVEWNIPVKYAAKPKK